MQIHLLTTLVDILPMPMGRPLAYIDPGSGSILLQLIIAGALGALVVLRTSWGRLKSFFRRGAPTEETADESEDDG